MQLSADRLLPILLGTVPVAIVLGLACFLVLAPQTIPQTNHLATINAGSVGPQNTPNPGPSSSPNPGASTSSSTTQSTTTQGQGGLCLPLLGCG